MFTDAAFRCLPNLLQMSKWLNGYEFDAGNLESLLDFKMYFDFVDVSMESKIPWKSSF